MTLADVTSALRRFKWLAIGIFAAFCLVGLAAAFLPGDRYASAVTVLVAPADENDLSFGPAEAAQVLVPPVVTRVESDTFADAVAERLEDTLPQAAGVEFTAENEPGTALIEITALHSNADVPEEAAEAAVNELESDPVSTQIEVSAVNPPEAAHSQALERQVPVLAGAIMLGAIAGLFAALAAHATRKRVQGPELIRDEYGLQVLAEIPDYPSLPGTVELFERGWPPDVLEGYQRLAASLQVIMPGRGSIAVTSWDEEEGKTGAAAAIAWAVAGLSRATLVVDCDLRHPRLHEALGGRRVPGVAELGRRTEPEQMIQRTSQRSLRLLSAGEAHGHPAATIARALPRILAEAPADLIVIDTPPMIAAETTTIMSMVDGVIVVLDMKRRTPNELEAALHDIRVAQANVIGVVLNRSDSPQRKRASTYYYRGYLDARDDESTTGDGTADEAGAAREA